MASAMGNTTPVSSLAISNFSNSLQCPVTFEPLTDAVMLIPCGHTISEFAANNMFHGMRGEMVDTQAPCPLCRNRVKAYYPNMIMRSLVESALGVESADLAPAVSKILAETLPTTSATVAVNEIDIDSIPFPGIGAKFVLTRGDWTVSSSGGPGGAIRFAIRFLEFKSQNPDSIFTEMGILGFMNGCVSISININRENRNTGSDYLARCGINLALYQKDGGFYISNLNTTKILFKILALHNEIPADKFPLIRELAISGDWRSVTPLQPGEVLAPEETIDRSTYDTPSGRLGTRWSMGMDYE